jgi:hypothetical protein
VSMLQEKKKEETKEVEKKCFYFDWREEGIEEEKNKRLKKN